MLESYVRKLSINLFEFDVSCILLKGLTIPDPTPLAVIW